MWKMWCIKYKKPGIFGHKPRFCVFGGLRVDSIVKEFHEKYPECFIEEIYVQYIKR